MSYAQRRTTLEGIDTILSPISDDTGASSPSDRTLVSSPASPTSGHSHRRRSRRSSAARSSHRRASSSIPVEDGKDVWQALSYDPFGTAGPPRLEHYESFPPELAENVAAYEVPIARRLGQVTFAVTACVLASGIVCGFAALKPILIAEGVYSSLCPADWPVSDSEIPCPEQDMRLNLFFIAASITLNVSTVLAGYILDSHGRRTCYLLAALILAFGGATMALAFHLGDARLHLHLLLPGTTMGPFFLDAYLLGNTLLGLGGTFLFVSSYTLSNAFPRHSGLIVALVTGAFDASAAVFLFYRLAYQAFPGSQAVKPAVFFAAFGVLVSAVIVVAEFALMSGHGYHTKREYQVAIARAQQRSHSSSASSSSAIVAHGGGNDEAPSLLEALEAITGDAEARRADRRKTKARQDGSGVQGILQPQRSAARSQPSVTTQMRTPWFIMLLLLTVTQMTRMNYFIATVRAQYRVLLGGDEDAAERVNGLFDVALPVAGVVTTPFIGVLLNSVPVWATLAVLTGLVGVLGVLNCVRGSEAAAYATVVAFVLLRPLYYSAVSDYATKVFGFATFGRIYGTVICVSGLAQLVQPTLDAAMHGPLHEDPVPLNVAFAVSGTAIAAALTGFVFVKTRANAAAGKQGEEVEQVGERRGLLGDARGPGGYEGV